MTLRLSASLAITGDASLQGSALLAERAGLDFVVLEGPADALVAASWLIPLTTRVGLVPRVQTTYGQPFHTARSLSAMDILSGGRTGWLPTCDAAADLSAAYGAQPPLDSNAAIDKAAEYIAATQALWDSWDADALIIDKASAVYLDSAKIRRVDFRGEYFRVMGPLNAARPLQGYPVLFQDDGHPGFDRIGRGADVLLVGAATPDAARARVASLRSQGARRILVKVHVGAATAAALSAVGSASQILEQVSQWQHWLDCDGMHLLDGATAALLPLLEAWSAHSPVRDAQVPTLRARLGAPLPINRYGAA